MQIIGIGYKNLYWSITSFKYHEAYDFACVFVYSGCCGDLKRFTGRRRRLGWCFGKKILTIHVN